MAKTSAKQIEQPGTPGPPRMDPRDKGKPHLKLNFSSSYELRDRCKKVVAKINAKGEGPVTVADFLRASAEREVSRHEKRLGIPPPQPQA